MRRKGPHVDGCTHDVCWIRDVSADLCSLKWFIMTREEAHYPGPTRMEHAPRTWQWTARLGVYTVRKEPPTLLHSLIPVVMSSNAAHAQSTHPWGSSSSSAHPALGSSLTDTFGQSRTHYQPGYMMVSRITHPLLFASSPPPRSLPNSIMYTHLKMPSILTKYPSCKPRQK